MALLTNFPSLVLSSNCNLITVYTNHLASESLSFILNHHRKDFIDNREFITKSLKELSNKIMLVIAFSETTTRNKREKMVKLITQGFKLGEVLYHGLYSLF